MTMTTDDAQIARAPRRSRKPKTDDADTPKRAGPTMRRHRSEQDVETPPELIEAVEARFSRITFDLAATPENTKAAKFFGPKSDSLSQNWGKAIGDGVGWLNPPFGNILPWARACAELAVDAAPTPMSDHAKLLMLVPASVGSNWFHRHVHGIARVYILAPRVTFVGHGHPYLKDLMLCVYARNQEPLFDVWRWRNAKGRGAPTAGG